MLKYVNLLFIGGINRSVIPTYVNFFFLFVIFRPVMFRFVNIAALYAISYFHCLAPWNLAQLARFSLDAINNESQYLFS